MSHSFQVTFDAGNPAKLADFWEGVLGYERPSPPDGHDSWESFLTEVGVPAEEWDKADALIDPDGDGPRLFFQKVPESKTAKNRMHLDVQAGTDDLAARAQELVALGATLVAEYDEPEGRWITMLDPEGNEFCVH